MLDSTSLDVILRFKLALLTRAQKPVPPAELPQSNRGKKLGFPVSEALTPKVVEYAGTNHLVLTNDVIERSNYRNKRRWLDFYKSQHPNVADSSTSGLEESESDSDAETDESPMQKLRLSEILAPLAHPSELVTHPAISKTYKLPCLGNLALDLIDLIEVEQHTLNQLNKLLQVLDGEDWFYLLEENMGLPQYDHGLDETAEVKQDGEKGDSNGEVKSEKGNSDAVDAAVEGTTENAQSEGEQSAQSGNHENTETNGEIATESNKRITRLTTAGDVSVTDPFFALPKTLALYEASQKKQMEDAEELTDELESVQQELVNYLQVSIQRQYEYIKNLTTLRNGIVKAERYKNDLYKWGKEMHEKKN